MGEENKKETPRGRTLRRTVLQSLARGQPVLLRALSRLLLNLKRELSGLLLPHQDTSFYRSSTPGLLPLPHLSLKACGMRWGGDSTCSALAVKAKP